MFGSVAQCKLLTVCMPLRTVVIDGYLFVEQIMADIKKNNLQVYDLPPCDEDEDESFKAKHKEMKAIFFPF